MTELPDEILLHIGHGKTGTSFIQSALALSKQKLNDAGIDYPISGPVYEAATRGEITGGNFGRQRGIESQIAHRGNPQLSKVLFSAESLFFRLIAKDDGGAFSALQHEMPEITKRATVRILLYIRDPVEHAVSNYQQQLKRRGLHHTFEVFLRQYNMPGKARRALVLLEEAGCDVTVYNYSRYKKKLLNSVESWLGIPAGTLVAPEAAQVNRSLTLGEQEMVRALNARLGTKTNTILADRLCNALPHIRAEWPQVSSEALAAFLERMEKAAADEDLVRLVPEAERYRIGTLEDYAEAFRGYDAAAPAQLAFTPEQIAVIVDGFASHLEKERNRVRRSRNEPQDQGELDQSADHDIEEVFG